MNSCATTQRGGIACHTGTPSCFNKLVYGSTDDTAAILPELIRTIRDRKENPCDESYTCKLFNDETEYIIDGENLYVRTEEV